MEVLIFLGVGDKDKPPLRRGGYRESNSLLSYVQQSVDL